MSGVRVLVDADCLHKLYLRTLLLTLATEGDIQLLWTEEIFTEASQSLIARFPESSSKLRQKFKAIKTYFYDTEVTGYEHLVGSLGCRDENDEHVLAAAIQGRADVLLTFNLRDFPSTVESELEIVHPDAFLTLWFTTNFKAGISGLAKWLVRFTNPRIESASASILLTNLGGPNMALFVRLNAGEIDEYIGGLKEGNLM